MTVREDAHRLLDAVPDEQLAGVVELLRGWAVDDQLTPARRELSFIGAFEAEPDLSTRVREVLRQDFGGESATA